MSAETSGSDRRVVVHIGLPKTGTSYLQSIVWEHRAALRDAGLLVPGRERRDHLWASLSIRDDPSIVRRDPHAAEAWPTVLAELADWPGSSLVSHEFLCSATTAQAQAMVDTLAETTGAEVHVVVTAREPLSLFTSSWQEHLKNKGTRRIGNYARRVSEDPTAIWNWRALDLRLVLERWGGVVAPDRVHVITAPGREEPRDELWRRFCTVLEVDPAVAGPGRFTNSTMGVAQAETLRRLNERLEGFDAPFDRGVWIRSFLADERLVPLGGDPYWPDDDQVAECRVRGVDAVAHVRDHGYDVVGDLTSLLVPDDVPPRRHPDSVTDTEVADVALGLVAELMTEVRARSREERAAPTDPPPSGVRRVLDRLGRLRSRAPRAEP